MGPQVSAHRPADALHQGNLIDQLEAFRASSVRIYLAVRRIDEMKPATALQSEDRESSGRGARKHREFAMASGKIDRDALVAFLTNSLGTEAQISKDGALHFACVDWRHVEEL